MKAFSNSDGIWQPKRPWPWVYWTWVARFVCSDVFFAVYQGVFVCLLVLFIFVYFLVTACFCMKVKGHKGPMKYQATIFWTFSMRQINQKVDGGPLQNQFPGKVLVLRIIYIILLWHSIFCNLVTSHCFFSFQVGESSYFAGIHGGDHTFPTFHEESHGHSGLGQAFHAPGTKGPSELSCSSCGKFIAETWTCIAGYFYVLFFFLGGRGSVEIEIVRFSQS